MKPRSKDKAEKIKLKKFILVRRLNRNKAMALNPHTDVFMEFSGEMARIVEMLSERMSANEQGVTLDDMQKYLVETSSAFRKKRQQKEKLSAVVDLLAKAGLLHGPASPKGGTRKTRSPRSFKEPMLPQRLHEKKSYRISGLGALAIFAMMQVPTVALAATCKGQPGHGPHKVSPTKTLDQYCSPYTPAGQFSCMMEGYGLDPDLPGTPACVWT